MQGGKTQGEEKKLFRGVVLPEGVTIFSNTMIMVRLQIQRTVAGKTRKLNFAESVKIPKVISKKELSKIIKKVMENRKKWEKDPYSIKSVMSMPHKLQLEILRDDNINFIGKATILSKYMNTLDRRGEG